MTDGASEVGRMERKTKVFICYSWVDRAFADCIVAALNERGFEARIDRQDIPPFQPFGEEIRLLIRQVDTVVFVLSPDAASSRYCQEEVEYAASLNKRLGGVVWKKVSAPTVPENLGALQWIDFEPPAPFDERMDQLVKALETDIDWIRKHTQFGEAAHRWHAADRPGPCAIWVAVRPLNSSVSICRRSSHERMSAVKSAQSLPL